ncbi:MAG: C-GCAxxG-C-C family protein [Desulfobacterales bacterium]|nr:C-GCAxxG-C-C family protein [Desulfobacterales bacterium]
MKEAKKCDQDRRKVLISAGALAAGAAVVSSGVTSFVSKAQAGGTTTYPYKKLNLAEVGRIAHATYFSRFCAETVMTGIFKPLAKSVGAPYDAFPLGSVFWAHGGFMGWGTGCGTLVGAGMAVGLIAGSGSDGQAIINDVIAYYAYEKLPHYKPEAGQAKAQIHNTSLADTPICHISVGKWMKKENVGFFTMQRKERCARLSADIAIYTAKLLNEWADGKYKPRNKPLANAIEYKITSQTNCTDCHGDNIPDLPGT